MCHLWCQLFHVRVTLCDADGKFARNPEGKGSGRAAKAIKDANEAKLCGRALDVLPAIFEGHDPKIGVTYRGDPIQIGQKIVSLVLSFYGYFDRLGH